MKKILMLFMLLSTFAISTTFNPIEGSKLKVGVFHKSTTGTINKNSGTGGTDCDVFIEGYLEHPISFIPLVKIEYTEFIDKGIGKIADNLNLTIYDLTFYYEVLDNGINADVGINLKHVEGKILISSVEKYKSKKLKLSVPMIYAKVGFDVPRTNLSLQVEGNYITQNGENIYDAQAGLRYTFDSGFGIETGYKVMNLKFNEVDDLNVENKFSGLYGKLVKAF